MALVVAVPRQDRLDLRATEAVQQVSDNGLLSRCPGPIPDEVNFGGVWYHRATIVVQAWDSIGWVRKRRQQCIAICCRGLWVGPQAVAACALTRIGRKFSESAAISGKIDGRQRDWGSGGRVDGVGHLLEPVTARAGVGSIKYPAVVNRCDQHPAIPSLHHKAMVVESSMTRNQTLQVLLTRLE